MFYHILIKTMKRRVDKYMNLQRALAGEKEQGFVY